VFRAKGILWFYESERRHVFHLMLAAGVLALFGLAYWLTTDSDDDCSATAEQRSVCPRC
jgi:hypothetical protein